MLEPILRSELTRLGGEHGAVRIAWSRAARGTQLSSIRLASYSFATGWVLVHPRLNDPRVPVAVLQFLVWHELLHRELGAEHGPEFRRREAMHPQFRTAVAWQAQHLEELKSAAW